MTPKYLKGFCALCAVWIYLSSCVVITRMQFASFVTNATGLRQEFVLNVMKGSWWLADRMYHAFEFTLLTTLLLHAFPYFKRRPFAALPLVMAFAASDEFHQMLVNPKAAHAYDVVVDSLGAFIALYMFIRVQIKQDALSMNAA